MRQSGLKGVFGLAVAAAGVALVVLHPSLLAGIVVFPRNSQDPSGGVLGVVLIIAGAAIAFRSFRVAGQGTRLAAATLARWRVSPNEWAAFRQSDAARAARLRSLANKLEVRAVAPPDGVEVAIGETAVMVDGAVFTFNAGASRATYRWLCEVEAIDPGCLEFTIYQRDRYGADISALRVPVPAAAREQAEHLLAHFRAAIDPRRKATAVAEFEDHFRAAAAR